MVDPELSVHYITFRGLRWRLSVLLYVITSMLKCFAAAKNCPVKIGPQNGAFSKIINGDPQRHFLAHNDQGWICQGGSGGSTPRKVGWPPSESWKNTLGGSKWTPPGVQGPSQKALWKLLVIHISVLIIHSYNGAPHSYPCPPFSV